MELVSERENVYTNFSNILLPFMPSPFCLFTFISIQPIDNFSSLTCAFPSFFFLNSSLSKSHTHEYNGCTLYEERISILDLSFSHVRMGYFTVTLC